MFFKILLPYIAILFCLFFMQSCSSVEINRQNRRCGWFSCVDGRDVEKMQGITDAEKQHIKQDLVKKWNRETNSNQNPAKINTSPGSITDVKYE